MPVKQVLKFCGPARIKKVWSKGVGVADLEVDGKG